MKYSPTLKISKVFAWLEQTFAKFCYSCRRLWYIPFQPNRHSVHTNVGSDDHMITFANDKLLGWLTWFWGSAGE
jgi:hypothetical protein